VAGLWLAGHLGGWSRVSETLSGRYLACWSTGQLVPGLWESGWLVSGRLVSCAAGPMGGWSLLSQTLSGWCLVSETLRGLSMISKTLGGCPLAGLSSGRLVSGLV
jgi:hypothetical protein